MLRLFVDEKRDRNDSPNNDDKPCADDNDKNHYNKPCYQDDQEDDYDCRAVAQRRLQDNKNDIDTSYGWNGGIGKNRCGAHWAEYYIRDKLKPLSTGFSSNVSVPDLIERYHWNKSGDVRSKDGLRKAPYFGDFVNHYAGIIYDANNFTFVASGYYRPTRSGQYTFCANVDDAENFWFGSDNAFPCGQATNDEFRTGMTPRIYTVYVRNWPPEARKTECWETTLKAGYYYPFRSVMGNWAGASRMTFMVKRPDNSGYVTDVEGEAFPKTC